jgi:hypothetical protein
MGFLSCCSPGRFQLWRPVIGPGRLRRNVPLARRPFPPLSLSFAAVQPCRVVFLPIMPCLCFLSMPFSRLVTARSLCSLHRRSYSIGPNSHAFPIGEVLFYIVLSSLLCFLLLVPVPSRSVPVSSHLVSFAPSHFVSFGPPHIPRATAPLSPSSTLLSRQTPTRRLAKTRTTPHQSNTPTHSSRMPHGPHHYPHHRLDTIPIPISDTHIANLAKQLLSPISTRPVPSRLSSRLVVLRFASPASIIILPVRVRIRIGSDQIAVRRQVVRHSEGGQRS